MTPRERAAKLAALTKESAVGFERLTERQVREAIREVERTRETLTDIIVQNAGDDGVIKRERASSMLASLDRIERDIQSTGLATTTRAVEAAGERGARDMERIMDGSNVPKIGLAFNEISADSIRYVTTRFGEDGLVLSDRLWKFAGGQKAELESVIRAGITQGKAISEMRRDVDRVYKQSRYAVDRLIRTEMNTAYRVTSAYTAQRSPVVRFLRIVRGAADRPTHRCTVLSKEDRYGAGDGVFRVDDTEIYNPHPNCTSYLLFVLDDELVDVAEEFTGGEA